MATEGEWQWHYDEPTLCGPAQEAFQGSEDEDFWTHIKLKSSQILLLSPPLTFDCMEGCQERRDNLNQHQPPNRMSRAGRGMDSFFSNEFIINH